MLRFIKDIFLDSVILLKYAYKFTEYLTNKHMLWQDPPPWLSIDLSSTSEIDEDNDGIWNIVGGKVSKNREF